jgi:hypothetical protein
MRDVSEGSKASMVPINVFKYKIEGAAQELLSQEFSGVRNGSIPLRYFVPRDAELIQEEDHSFDAELAFKAFTGNLIFKDEMDDVYTLSEGLKFYLKSKTDENGNQRYPHLVRFLEDHVFIHILQTSPDARYGKKEYNFIVSPELANSIVGKAMGLKPGKLSINFYALALKLRNITSLVAMGLKPIPAMFNGALIIALNAIKATGGSINVFLGTPPEKVDMTLESFLKGHKAWLGYLRDSFTGQGDNSKL